MGRGDLGVVGVVLAQEVFKKGVNVHGAHPALEPDRVLLDFLGTLALVCVWRCNSQVQGQLRPGLYLFGVELADELEQGPGAESVAIALGRGAEQLDQLGSVGGGGEVGVAVEDEGGIGAVNRVVGYAERGQMAVVWHEGGGELLGLAGGREGREARRGMGRGRV